MSWLRAVGVAAGLVGGGVVGEAIAERRDRLRFPPPGDFVSVGGRRLHVQTRGKGDTTIVLDASLGAWSSHWSLVAAALAEHARVVAYDRAGLGWSDPQTGSLTLASLATDLEIVIESQAPGQRVIAVGHGLGALVTHLLAARDPDRVAGLAVIDGFPFDFAGSMTLPTLPQGAASDSELMHATGVTRVSEWFRRGSGETNAIAALSMQKRVRRASAAERELVIANRDVTALRAALDIPLRVVASSRPFGRGKPNDYSLRWFAHNEELGQGSDECMHYVVRDSDHWIPQHRPDAVVEPVRGLIAQVGRLASSRG